MEGEATPHVSDRTDPASCHMFETILTVCVGNICRSPMAEGLLRERLSASGKSVRVASAGLQALAGHPADAMATALLTTFYGALIAQAIALPIMTKLHMRATQESREQRLILEGIRGIQDGINPRILRGLLETFLPSRDRHEDT